MMTIYKSTENGLNVTDSIEDGIWINLVTPTELEIQQASDALSVDVDFVRAALDEEERSRIELDEESGNVLIVVDIPLVEFKRDSVVYETYPLGIVYTSTGILTVSLKETIVIKNFANSNVKTFYTYKKSRFVLQILYRNAALFLKHLKQIDRHSNNILSKLHKTMMNRELIQLMELEKSLVYFSTSLRANELVIEKLLRYDFIKKYPEDEDLLEDIITENKQAIEMAKIYSDILSSTMVALTSLISNNINISLKILSAIVSTVGIPLIISGFMSMNTPNPLQNVSFGFWLIVALCVMLCTGLLYYLFKKKKL